jgi:3-dehydroquinate synthase
MNRRSIVTQQAHFEIRVDVSQRSEIDVGFGALRRLREFACDDLAQQTVAVVSDSNVFPIYGTLVTEQLESLAARVESIVLPAGESTKSSSQLNELWTRFAQWQLNRDSVVVALGGGVIGDLAGFAAATYSRGLRWWGLPTSLMAQVDSGIGGKVGVNLPSAKNLVGSFWQPAQVVVDPAVLTTLGERDFCSGLAEVVKYGVIQGPPLFERIEQSVQQIKARDPTTLFEIVSACCQSKAAIVQSDPWEQSGGRAVLNYGHTFAHALESALGYGQLSHGEAVSIGMTCAARLARRLWRVDNRLCESQQSLLARLGLPTEVPSSDSDKILSSMLLDKKNRAGKLRLVLPRRLGQLELVADVAPAQVLAALSENTCPSEDPI